jgi:hypothetical protein
VLPREAAPGARGPGEVRRANADPVTGQGAWYDLRVRLRAVPGGQRSLRER